MPTAILAVFRAAIPWAAAMFGSYVVSDVYNESMAAKQAQVKADYPAIVTGVFKKNPTKWKFLAIGGLLVGALTVFLTKKFK